MSNQTSTAVRPPRAFALCLELSQVFDLETCDDTIRICFQLQLTQSIFSKDVLTKHTNVKIILQHPFFVYLISYWWRLENRNNDETCGNDELDETKFNLFEQSPIQTSRKATNIWMTLQILTGIIPECGTMSLLHAIDRNTHISLLPPSRMQRYEPMFMFHQTALTTTVERAIIQLRWIIVEYRMLRQSCTCLRY